jgi:hypothetical protein
MDPLGDLSVFKVDLKETGCEVVDWFQLAWDRVQWQALVNTKMNLHGVC